MKNDTIFSLDEEARRYLLALARWSIATRFDETASEPKAPMAGGLQECCGLFVTLRKEGDLRGCIGHISSDKMLPETVRVVARSAAFDDSRFDPVMGDELPAIDIEISLLTPPVPVASYEEIIIGRHGLILSRGFHRALFLPQVAIEQGWDRETTLDYLARKAGLGRDDWRSGCSFEVFEAIHFAEK